MSSQTSYKTLQKIWDNVSRHGPDGKKKIFFKTRDDLVYLYSTGFVDENRHSLLDWVAAFDDSKQKDGSYLITEEQWMEKVIYHYSGPIGIPFEPMTLREGEWSEEEMEHHARNVSVSRSVPRDPVPRRGKPSPGTDSRPRSIAARPLPALSDRSRPKACRRAVLRELPV